MPRSQTYNVRTRLWRTGHHKVVGLPRLSHLTGPLHLGEQGTVWSGLLRTRVQVRIYLRCWKVFSCCVETFRNRCRSIIKRSWFFNSVTWNCKWLLILEVRIGILSFQNKEASKNLSSSNLNCPKLGKPRINCQLPNALKVQRNIIHDLTNTTILKLVLL